MSESSKKRCTILDTQVGTSWHCPHREDLVAKILGFTHLHCSGLTVNTRKNLFAKILVFPFFYVLGSKRSMLFHPRTLADMTHQDSQVWQFPKNSLFNREETVIQEDIKRQILILMYLNCRSLRHLHSYLGDPGHHCSSCTEWRNWWSLCGHALPALLLLTSPAPVQTNKEELKSLWITHQYQWG